MTKIQLISKPVLLLIGLLGLLIGLGFRFFILHTPQLRAISSDEAVVGLEAIRILHGHFRAFFWGQHYGGTLETSIVALAFAIYRPSVIALSVVPVFLDLIATLLIWRIARYFLTELEAVVGSIIFFIAPASFVWWSTKEAGFYWITIDLGLLIMLLGVRLVNRHTLLKTELVNTADFDQDPYKRFPEVFEWILIGIFIGLGWWNSPDIMYFLVPTTLWVIYKRPNSFLKIPIVLLGAIVGALPWLWANLNNGFLSLKIPSFPIANNSYLYHLEVFFSGDLPVALGLKVPYKDHWIFHGAQLGYFLVVLPVLATGLVVSYKRFNLLTLTIVIYPFILAISPFSWYVGEGRYVTFLAPFLSLLIVITLGVFGQYIVIGLGTAIIGILTGVGLLMMDAPQLSPTINNIAVPASFKPLEHLLIQKHIHYVYANYWIAYRLTFETDLKVIAAPTAIIRYKPYNKLVASSFDPAHIFLKGSPNGVLFINTMHKTGETVFTYSTGNFVIYKPVTSLGTNKT